MQCKINPNCLSPNGHNFTCIVSGVTNGQTQLDRIEQDMNKGWEAIGKKLKEAHERQERIESKLDSLLKQMAEIK